MHRSIFQNATQTDGAKPEELENLEDQDFEILRSIINGLRPQFLKRRTTNQPLCEEDDRTFFEKIPIDHSEDVIGAHRDIKDQFLEWLDALRSECNTLVIAGNGSKTFVCNMFANFISENTEDHVLELNPNSPTYTTNKARKKISDVLDDLEEEDGTLWLIIHSADLPIAQDLIYNSLLPSRTPESRLKLILALDTLLIHAQVQLWGLRHDFLLKDGIHTFLDFRLELLQQWLKKKPILRQLLGESPMTGASSPSFVLEQAGMIEFGVNPANQVGTTSEMSASAADSTSFITDTDSSDGLAGGSDSDDDSGEDQAYAASENEEISNKEVMRATQQRPVTAPNRTNEPKMMTRSRARLAK